MSKERHIPLVIYRNVPLDYAVIPTKSSDGAIYYLHQLFYSPHNGEPQDLMETLQKTAEEAYADIDSIEAFVEATLRHSVIVERQIHVDGERMTELKFNLDNHPLPLKVIATPSNKLGIEMGEAPNRIMECLYSAKGHLSCVISGQDQAKDNDYKDYINYFDEMMDVFHQKHPNATEDEISEYQGRVTERHWRLYSGPQSMVEINGRTIKFYESSSHFFSRDINRQEDLFQDKVYDFYGDQFIVHIDTSTKQLITTSTRKDNQQKIIRIPLFVDPTFARKVRDLEGFEWADPSFAEQFTVKLPQG